MEDTIQEKAVINLTSLQERLMLNTKFLNFFRENATDTFHLKTHHYVSANLRENPVKSFRYDFIPAGLDIVVCYSSAITLVEMQEHMQKNNGIPLSTDNLMMLTNNEIFQKFLLKEFSNTEPKKDGWTIDEKSIVAPAHREKLICFNGDPGYLFYPEIKVGKKIFFEPGYKDFYDGPLKFQYDINRLFESPSEKYFVFFRPKQGG